MDTAHETAIEIARDYACFIEDEYQILSTYYGDGYYSYVINTLDELIFQMYEKPNIPPMTIIDEYIITMKRYYERKGLYCFFVAQEAARELEDLLMGVI